MGRSSGFWRRLAALVGALAALCALLTLAAAEDAPALIVDFTVSPNVMVAPGEVTMTFVIANAGERPVQNIYIASSDGLLSEPIGQLRPGESQTLLRQHTVTQEELDAGRIVYTVSHDPLSGSEKAVYSLSAAIVKGEPQPGVSFTRRLSSDSVSVGGLVTVTYKIANTGNVPLTALRIRDTLGDFTGRLEQLDVGDAKTFISRVTLGEAAESAPVLEYAGPSGDEFSIALDPAPIRIADSALDISFSVGKSVFENDTADAILILTNTGNVDYSGITVVDDVYGGVIADAIALPSGSAPVEVSHTYPLRGEGEYRWRITGMNSANESLDLRTETLTVPGEPESGAVEIEIAAAARTPVINRAGRVTFDITVTNTGDAMARDALLYEVNRGAVRTLAVVPTGEPSRCTAGYDVSGAEQFIFCLSYTDAQGRKRAVTSAPVDVTVAAGGAYPEPAGDDGGRLRGASVKIGGSGQSFVVLLIIAGAALTVMITILVVTSLRARRERMKRVAAEKQRIKAELDKTGSFPAVKLPAKRKASKQATGNRQQGKRGRH